VNVPSGVPELVEKRIKSHSFTPRTYGYAQQDILKLMNTDSLPIYIKSDFYNELMYVIDSKNYSPDGTDLETSLSSNNNKKLEYTPTVLSSLPPLAKLKQPNYDEFILLYNHRLQDNSKTTTLSSASQANTASVKFADEIDDPFADAQTVVQSDHSQTSTSSSSSPSTSSTSLPTVSSLPTLSALPTVALPTVNYLKPVTPITIASSPSSSTSTNSTPTPTSAPSIVSPSSSNSSTVTTTTTTTTTTAETPKLARKPTRFKYE
jgi:hypothetical protein